jgi:hypothetical protein
VQAPVEYGLAQNHTERKRGTVAPQPLRMYFDFDDLGTGLAGAGNCESVGQSVVVEGITYTCAAGDIMSQALKDRIVATTAKLQAWAQSALSIIRPTGALVAQDTTLCGRPISSAKYTAGSSSPVVTQYDMIMKVTAWPTGGNVLGTNCLIDRLCALIVLTLHAVPTCIDDSNTR